MKIILIPGNTDLNRGDQALIWESVRLVEDACTGAEITLMKGEDKRQYAQTERLGYPMIKTILKHPGRVFKKNNHVRYSVFDMAVMGVIALYDLLLSAMLLFPSAFINRFALLFMSKDCKTTTNAFRDCDAVVVKGGGFIHSYGAVIDAYQMYYLLYYMLLAIRYEKKILLLPNSIGPLKSVLARKLALYVLNRSEYISVRESVSYDFLLAQKGLRPKIYQHADLGFYLHASEDFDAMNYLRKWQIDSINPIVGITLRPYRFPGEINPEDKYRNYIYSFAALCQHLGNKHYQIVLFSHTLGPSSHENDTLAVKDLSAELRRKGILHVCIEDFDLDCRQVMSIYSKYDFLIGTRFHSVIFAQNSYVPTIAIAYGGNKGAGIMKDSGLSGYSIPMNEISGDGIISMFDKLENEKEEVKQKLIERRNIINHDRSIIVEEVRSALMGA